MRVQLLLILNRVFLIVTVLKELLQVSCDDEMRKGIKLTDHYFIIINNESVRLCFACCKDYG